MGLKPIHQNRQGEFLVTRITGPIANPLVVQYQISTASTAVTTDYQVLTGSVTIPVGRRSAATIRGAYEDIDVTPGPADQQ